MESSSLSKDAPCGQWRYELRAGNFWNMMSREFSFYSGELMKTQSWDKSPLIPHFKFRVYSQSLLKVLTQRSSLTGPFPPPACR